MANFVDNIFVTDLSMELHDVAKLAFYFKKAFVIDHHETTKDVKFPSGIKNIINTNASGTALVYKWMKEKLKYNFSPELKLLAKIINDYDLFKLKYEDSLIVNELFWKMHFWDFFDRFKDGWNPTSKELKIGKYSIQEKIDNIKNLDKEGFGKLMVVVSPNQINEIQFVYQDFNVYLIISDRDKLSLRSKIDLTNFIEDIKEDYPDIIKSAGGHKFACGIELRAGINILEQDDFMEDLFLYSNPK